MKIAVLADIHANLAALHAVLADIETWSPDVVIVAGDIINRGPQSVECLDLILDLGTHHGWRVMRGNHEDYILNYERDHSRHKGPISGLRREISRINGWTYQRLKDHLDKFASLPERIDLEIPGGILSVLHASLRHNRDGVLNRSSDDELRQQIDPAATIFCVGHTHMPFIRQIDTTLLINVGAVGLPFDGDTRAAYARLTYGRQGWRARIVRVRYDLDEAVHAFRASGMIEECGAVAGIMLRELQTGQSLMFDFVPAYLDRIHVGEISIDDAVSEFLTTLDRAA